MRFFDTHAHIGLINEDPIEQLIIVKEAKQEHIERIISISNNLRDFFLIYENLKTAPHVLFSIGVSPSEVSNPGDDWEMKVIEGSKMDRVVGIGEIGLDYFRKGTEHNLYAFVLAKQTECQNCSSAFHSEFVLVVVTVNEG